MAGTRLWISTIILAELAILAVLSLFYGLCVQNDDILCHAFSDSENAPGSLRALERPSWWSTTLHIHLVVEKSQNLRRWAERLEEWTKEFQIEDLPYFGSTQIHMNVVAKDDSIWERKGDATVKLSDKSSIFSLLPDRQLGSTISERKDLDWMLYIPASAPTENNTSKLGGNSSMPMWSAWKQSSHQLVTISTKMTDELDLPSLISLVGPWLQESSDSEFISSESSSDYLRRLQLTWHEAILQDFDDWKMHLTAIEKRDVILALGKPPKSFSCRLQSLLQVRSVLEGAMERNKEMLASEFPLEHYAAIFLPLLFPLLMPFLTSFVKELKRFKRKVKMARQKKQGKASSQGQLAEALVSKERNPIPTDVTK